MGYYNGEQDKPDYDVNLFNRKSHAVPVIASFSADGKMIPLYFAAEGIRIKIQKIIWSREGLVWGSHYRCEICVEERTQEINLQYKKNTNTWFYVED